MNTLRTLPNPVPSEPDPPNLPPRPNTTTLPCSDGQDECRYSQSFKDTLIGSFMHDHAMDMEGWITSKIVTVGFVDEGKTIPKINFSKEVLDILSKPWKKAIVRS